MKINILRKNYILLGIVAMLTLIMGITYAVFVISSDSYRASEMYIGNLLYGIEITNEDDTTDNINNLTVILSPNEERTIKVKINSLNPVDSKYKLQYTTSNNIEVKYTSDTPSPVIGDIEKENNPNDEVEIYIYLKNNENANTTITFGVKGGYNHNTSTSIELLPSYLAIIDEYTERDLILAITIDGETVESLPNTGFYDLESYECENSSTLVWEKMIKKLSISNPNLPESCMLEFETSEEAEISFTYTGDYTEEEDANYNYIKFLTSGIFTPNESFSADIFLVGGGGGSASQNVNINSYLSAGGGGGGGYTKTFSDASFYSIPLQINIGAGGVGGGNEAGKGGTTSMNMYSAEGGFGGKNSTWYGGFGGNGGSGGGAGGYTYSSAGHYFKGGIGGSDGANGGNGISSTGGGNSYQIGGTGQGTTTRAFGETTGTLYVGGGGGCGYTYNSSTLLHNFVCESAGAGGGAANTGGGGTNGSAGYSGIAIIRWSK